MKVWVVIKNIVHRIENDACWDDGCYDDYYETEIDSEELVGIYATEELAKQVVEQLENRFDIYDSVSYFEYEVIESL